MIKYQKGTFVTVPNKHSLAGIPTISQAVFMWICSYADEDGVCFPSRTTLADNAGCSVRSVDAAIEDLCARGLLVKQVRRDAKNAMRNLTSVYQIMLAPEGGVVQEVHHPSAGAARGVVQELRRELNPVLTQSKEEPEASASVPFEVVEDEPKKKAAPRNKEAFALTASLHDLFEKEHGVRPTTGRSDYFRVLAALKVLKPKEIVYLVEEALAVGKKRTVTEMLSQRSVDIYRQDNR